MMKIENICVKKSYTKDGEEKTVWPTVGALKTLDDGRKFIDLNIFPDTSFYVFEQKQREDKPQQQAPAQEIAPDDIPF